ncbi:hypothetical protein [Providencia hangzhouensis]|uniref:hypothetical protein n=1 Tax=Providencia hangzhouensis TaxID=3031799 RepID=UPI00397E5B73
MLQSKKKKSVIINKNCNEIKGDDPELNQLTIPIDVPEYYIAWEYLSWTSGDIYNNWSIMEYGYMNVLNLTSNYNFAPQYNIFICPTNTIHSLCVELVKQEQEVQRWLWRDYCTCNLQPKW